MNARKLAIAPIALVALLVGTSAHAVPQLQLDILGGTYNSSTQTIMANGNSFSLYAYYQGTSAPTGTFYLSMTLQPSSMPAGNYGTFTVNSTTISTTSGMTYGNPPLESISSLLGHDAGDLAQHGVFPAYFAERSFTFSPSNTSGVYNTQDSTGIGPQSGTGMFYSRFDFNIAGLAQGTGLHFDLYDEVVQGCGKNKNCVAGDIDINKFAPFSHDAQGMVSAIPEPETYAMLLAGLSVLGFTARRRKLKEAAAA